jgi:hypothetical protein
MIKPFFYIVVLILVVCVVCIISFGGRRENFLSDTEKEYRTLVLESDNKFAVVNDKLGKLENSIQNVNVAFKNVTNVDEHYDLFKTIYFKAKYYNIFINFTYFLDTNKKIMDTVDVVVIEQQLKTNPMAQRIEQHCISWFTFNYLDSKDIIVFPSRNKYLMLGHSMSLKSK